MTYENRPATNEEIIKNHAGYRTSYKHGILEVTDSRTETGVRHITRATAMVHNIEGVPMIKRRGKFEKLYGVFFHNVETGRGRATCLTILKPNN